MSRGGSPEGADFCLMLLNAKTTLESDLRRVFSISDNKIVGCHVETAPSLLICHSSLADA
jgi:hypothetical protein